MPYIKLSDLPPIVWKAPLTTSPLPVAVQLMAFDSAGLVIDIIEMSYNAWTSRGKTRPVMPQLQRRFAAEHGKAGRSIEGHAVGAEW